MNKNFIEILSSAQNHSVKPYNTKLIKSNAIWMANLALASYKTASEKDSTPDTVGILDALKHVDNNFISVKGFNHKSSQAIFVEHQDYVCMSFRGTDELADWLDNVNAFTSKTEAGQIHKGFYKATLDIWEDIFNAYQESRETKKRPLFITGHSLGGAMATVAAALLENLDIPFNSVYTFGQPRALERDTAKLFNVNCKNRFYRFQNNNDLVTRIPTRSMNYSHVGSCIYITEEKQLARDIGWWHKFLDSVDGVVSSITEKGLDAIEDHDMVKYVSGVGIWEWIEE